MVISANGKIYNHVATFDEFGYIDWRQTAKYKVGDTVYIYATKPYTKVISKTVVERVDSRKLSLYVLKENGLKLLPKGQ